MSNIKLQISNKNIWKLFSCCFILENCCK